MRTIRASEIGTYLFCRRAWWYQKQGMPSENRAELAGGSLFHRRHGRSVLRANLLRTAGWLLLGLSITLMVIALTLNWLR